MIYAVAGWITQNKPALASGNVVRWLHPHRLMDGDAEARNFCRELRSSTFLEEGQRLHLYILKVGEADRFEE